MTTSATALTNDLQGYITDHSLREPDVLQRLRRVTSDMSEGSWQVSPEQGQFMALLAGIAGVKRYLEVGTFTGYGTLWMALALPADGQIVSCEIEDSFPSVGRPFWAEADVTDMIDLRLAPAIETLDALIAEGQAGTFRSGFHRRRQATLCRLLRALPETRARQWFGADRQRAVGWRGDR